MIPDIKAYLYSALSVAGAFIMGYISFLRSSNARKEEKIDNLTSDINTQKEIHKDDIKRERFNSAQNVKADAVSSEDNLDKLEAKSEDSNDNNIVSVKL